MMITVKPLREPALAAGFKAMADRLAAGVSFQAFCDAFSAWEVRAFCDSDEVVGMLVTKDNELHVAVVPQVRGRWLSRRLIREVIGPLVKQYGEAKTRVMPTNTKGRDFVARIGFARDERDHLSILREGFEQRYFDPGFLLPAAIIGSSLFGADAASSAANTQATAANNATDAQLQIFNQGQANVAPWLQGGKLALGDIAKFLGIGGPTGVSGNATAPGVAQFNPSIESLENLPGYKFQLQQGENAVLNNRSATGGVNSGTTLKALNDYAQGQASSRYQQEFENWNTTLNNIFARLSGVSGTGANAGLGVAGIGSNVGANIGNNIVGAGNAQAAGQVGVANALSGGVSSLSNNFLLSKLLNGGGSSAAAGTVNDVASGFEFGA